MKLGLIGHPLGHSWSDRIHKILCGEEYHMWDLPEDELDDFMRKKDFDGINVTIPYKQKVMSYLDETDPLAEEIGAVNCIVSRNGRLKGYNTDYAGFRDMLAANAFKVKGRRTAVLGTGGACRAVSKALQQLGADIVHVSRRKGPGVIDYEQLYEENGTIELIVNTTPVGMYPHSEEKPIEISRFPHLKGVADIVANPLRTQLQFDAKMCGIPYCGGFEMLVRQAFAADEIFLDQKLDPERILKCMRVLNGEMRNIVLIGMPTSGKSTIARLLGEKTGRQVIEMDEEVVKRTGMSIPQCFAEKGEDFFRTQEIKTAADLKDRHHVIISCGGGVIKREETMRYLSENGIVVWVQRDPDKLFATASRPLTHNKENMLRMEEERRPLYEKYSDISVDNDRTLEYAVTQILKETGENL